MMTSPRDLRNDHYPETSTFKKRACDSRAQLPDMSDLLINLQAVRERAEANRKQTLRQLGFPIRLIGVSLLCTAHAAIRMLLNEPQAAETLRCLVLAMVAFLFLCAGSALLVLGSHIFAEVEVSDRWRPQTDRRHSVDPNKR